jgi:predicted transposase YbfD/YdcC
VATEEKSGAIKAIPELLKLLEIKGCIVTIGAMGCHKAITEQLLAQGADYLLAVKVNQPQSHAAVRDNFDTARAANFAQVPTRFTEEADGGHGRCEGCRCWLVEPHPWRGLHRLALVEAERHHAAQISRECRYYFITSPRRRGHGGRPSGTRASGCREPTPLGARCAFPQGRQPYRL